MTWSDLCLKDPAGFWVEKALGVGSVCTLTRTLTCTHKHVCTQAQASTRTHTRMHAYGHGHLHTCTHTHSPMHTPARPAPDLLQNQGLLGAVPSPCRGLSCPPRAPPDPSLRLSWARTTTQPQVASLGLRVRRSAGPGSPGPWNVGSRVSRHHVRNMWQQPSTANSGVCNARCETRCQDQANAYVDTHSGLLTDSQEGMWPAGKF